MIRRSVWAASAVLCVAALVSVLALLASRQRHEQELVQNLENLAFNLERSMESRLQAADVVLQSAQESFVRMSRHDEVSPESVSDAVRGLGQLLPAATELRGADAAGNVVYGQGIDPAQPLSVASRGFFQEARVGEGLIVGRPVLSRISRRWVLPVARALHRPSGDFAGVVYVNLPVSELQESLSGLKLGEHGVSSLFNTRFEILLRSQGMPLSEDESAVRHISTDLQAAVHRGAANQVLGTLSHLDGQARASLYRPVGRYPLYVAVGLARTSVMAPWWHEVWIAVGSWLLLCAAAVLYLRAQARSLRQQAAMLRDLEAAQAHLLQVSSFKSMFLANMSHEIRTPLNGVLGFAQVGLRLPRVGEEVRQVFRTIIDSGTLLNGILNDVLDMAKIEAGKLTLHPRPTAVRPLARRVAELVRQGADDKGVPLHVEVDEAVPELLLVDSLRLEQVLLNLLSNAVKFTETGRIRLALASRGGQVECVVQDTGIGMSPDHLGRLFSAFEQADGSTTRRYGGSGLGLAITKRLVDMMDGTIDVVSRPGFGTSFCVRLPLQAVAAEARPGADVSSAPGPAAVPASPASPPGAPALSTGSGPARAPAAADGRLPAAAPADPPDRRLRDLHFLVVEDNEVNQLMMRAMLKSEGATVSIVDNGQRALDWLERQAGLPDAVLMDVMMPVMDGYETSRRIHALHPRLPIFGQTAHAAPEDRERCLAAGMIERFVKPLDLDEVVDAMLRHLRPQGSAARVL